ncbi:hypothetical protein BC831DRAFT_444690 [Entophlyctis helioformis]|nr:hypothetical protein BC831DRAFT_444690 [Entophlyctis helioformis]
MPKVQTDGFIRLFFVNLALHARWTMTLYMFVKGIRWAARNNLSLVLVVALFFAGLQGLLQCTFVSQIILDCAIHLRSLYATWVIYTLLLDAVLYYRAWCISSSKSLPQKLVSILMVVGHTGCLVGDAYYSIRDLVDIPNVGCVTFPGWPRSLLGIFSTVNDFVQVIFFCLPLLQAVHSVAGMRRDTTAYRRMIMKSFVCLVCCTISSLAYIVLIFYDQQVISLVFLDLALMFQILGACEIQFNSHRETDKASLGAIVYQSPVQRNLMNPTNQSHPLPSDPASSSSSVVLVDGRPAGAAHGKGGHYHHDQSVSHVL